MTAKKNTPKKAQQEPPAGQEQPIGVAAEDIPEGGTGEVITLVVPMAAPPPSMEDRLAALELANIELEKRIGKMDTFIVRVARDHSYQYGGST